MEKVEKEAQAKAKSESKEQPISPIKAQIPNQNGQNIEMNQILSR